MPLHRMALRRKQYWSCRVLTRWQRTWNSHVLVVGMEMVQALWKTVWLFLKIKCTLTTWPTVPPRVGQQSFFNYSCGLKEKLSWLSYLQFWPQPAAASMAPLGWGYRHHCLQVRVVSDLTRSHFQSLDTRAFILIFLQLSLPLVLCHCALLVSTSFLSALPPPGPSVSPSAVFLQLLGSRQHFTVSKDPFRTPLLRLQPQPLTQDQLLYFSCIKPNKPCPPYTHKKARIQTKR